MQINLTKDELALIERYREMKIRSAELINHGSDPVVGRNWVIPDVGSGRMINCSLTLKLSS